MTIQYVLSMSNYDSNWSWISSHQKWLRGLWPTNTHGYMLPFVTRLFYVISWTSTYICQSNSRNPMLKGMGFGVACWSGGHRFPIIVIQKSVWYISQWDDLFKQSPRCRTLNQKLEFFQFLQLPQSPRVLLEKEWLAGNEETTFTSRSQKKSAVWRYLSRKLQVLLNCCLAYLALFN